MMETVTLSTIITARVRSTTGRYCFHRCLSVHRGGSGPAGRGGGVRSSWLGGGSGRVGRGGSGPASRGGSGPAGRGGGSAKIWQQKELLLRGGRYASCVHAGGLSCSYLMWVDGVQNKVAFLPYVESGLGFLKFSVLLGAENVKCERIPWKF